MEPNYESSRQEEERPLRDQSPEEAKRTVKEKVSRGVAAVAGAIEGFTQQMRDNDVPEKTKEAVEKVGETTRKVSEATRREGHEVKQALGRSGGESRESMGRSSPSPPTGTAHRAGSAGPTSEGLGSGREPLSGGSATTEKLAEGSTQVEGTKKSKLRRTHEDTGAFTRR